MSEVRYSFQTQWYDRVAQAARDFLLTFFAADGTLELYDSRNRRMFLKRCVVPNVSLKDLFVGATVSVYARQLQITDYADDFTRSKLAAQSQATLALVKPDAFKHTGKILSSLAGAGLKLAAARMLRLSKADAQEFYAEHKGRPFYDELTSFMSSGPIVAMKLVGNDAVRAWRDLIGPTNTFRARDEAPKSLRARFGTDGTRNACHGSDSSASADRELAFFFERAFPSTAVLDNCTLCIVKPHAMASAGDIFDAIANDGFEISALRSFDLERVVAEEFLEVYKGVVPEYTAMVDELCGGTLLALELRSDNAVQALRQLAGPPDPEIARQLRPNTLRARFGVDKARNAVHCTDLPEDGVLECEYFFQVLSGKR